MLHDKLIDLFPFFGFYSMIYFENADSFEFYTYSNRENTNQFHFIKKYRIRFSSSLFHFDQLFLLFTEFIIK